MDLKKQNEGTAGKLELWIEKYQHPIKLPVSADYYCEASMSNNVIKWKPKKATTETNIDYLAILTLPINDPVKDTEVMIRFMTKENTEVCRTIINILKL